MPKMISLLIATVLLGCTQKPAGDGSRGSMQNLEDISKEIMNNSFKDIDQLTGFLKTRGVSFGFRVVTEDYLEVKPTLCVNVLNEDFRFGYLILEGSAGPKMFRYRVYWTASGPVCIEEDFAFKNPY
jgi:hypothetical protein